MSDDRCKKVLAAYKAGKDCGEFGANVDNCHYRHFTTRHQTAAWEVGKAAGEKNKAEKEGKIQ